MEDVQTLSRWMFSLVSRSFPRCRGKGDRVCQANGRAYSSHIGPLLLDHLSGLLRAVPGAEGAVIIEAVDESGRGAGTRSARAPWLGYGSGSGWSTTGIKTLAVYEAVAEALVDSAIHQPIAVMSDVNLGRANRGREYRAGLAEIAKHVLISLSGLLDFVWQKRLRSGLPTATRFGLS